jgi:cyclic pyranopterin phosphate synthase
MRIYEFEDIDEWLDTIPLAARRALETTGCKVSLVAWRRMRLPARVAVTSLGGERKIDGRGVRDLLVDENVPFEPVTAHAEPPGATVPPDVVRAFGEGRAPDPRAWRALAPLDRYVLARLSRRGRSEKLRRAFEEMTASEDPAASGRLASADGGHALSTHLNARGEVHMVDVGGKDVTVRQATARARVRMLGETMARLRTGATPKGDVVATARVAAIMAAKRTPEIVPLCHAIALTRVDVDIALSDWGASVDVRVEARDRTGAEMEAMVGASAAALAIYDMLKGIDRGITFDVALLAKSGGKSGTWNRTD